MSDIIEGEIVGEIDEPGLALEKHGGSAVTQTSDVMALLQQAVERGVSVEMMSQLVDLQERVDAKRARAAFFEAMTAFRNECPPIPRTREKTSIGSRAPSPPSTASPGPGTPRFRATR
jgi:hypothetical protein